MKWKNVTPFILCFLILFGGVSCSLAGKKNTDVIATSQLVSTSSAPDRMAILEQENKALSDANESLKRSVSSLEANLKIAGISSLASNYHIDELLQFMYTEKISVDIFPGILQNIRVETIGGIIYFVFSIDRMAVNADWNGPGSAGGKGYFINTEEKYQDYKGRLGTVFAGDEYSGYESYPEKQKVILAKYNSKAIYNFYMIGDEIVFVGPDPGP